MDVKQETGSPVPTNRLAFARVARDHGTLLGRLARRLCDHDADAEDLVHDTFERALRAWDRSADHADVRSWLVAILHHLFIDRCRKARRAPRIDAIDAVGAIDGVELAAPAPSAGPAWASISDRDVEAALATIDGELRQVYELRVRGHSYDQIAAELAIPKRTVGTRLFRARQKLKLVLARAA